MVVGSLPRPQWVRELIEDRKTGRLAREDADRLLDSAIPSAIRMQERAGLDNDAQQDMVRPEGRH